MQAKEIRIRCIEAATGAGIRAVNDVIRDAEKLETWVNAVEDKEVTPPKRGRPKTADKD